MIEEPQFHPDGSMVFKVSEIMSIAAAIRTGQHNGTRSLCTHFVQMFSAPSVRVQVNKQTLGSGVFVELSHCYFPLLTYEGKRYLGEGGYDPLTLVSYTVLNQLAGESLARIREKCCCPTFALACGGPYLCVLGIAFTDKLVVQRLTDIMWLGEATTSEDKHLYRVTKVFAALKLCLEQLQEFHSDADNVTFLVQDSFESSRKYVVKFVDRYGVDAHMHLAGLGLAPELLYYGRLDGERDDREGEREDHSGPCGLYLGPLRMVVMTYIAGNTAGELPESQWPSDTYSQVSNALEKLHDEDFAFGDLRPPNIVFRDGDRKAFFIDFNWAGKSGRVHYPNNSGRGIREVAVVDDFDPIIKEHDLDMLKHYFR